MSDTENKSGKKLGLLGGNPSRPGQVRQSFSHGRSKSVVVETKRKRVIVPKPSINSQVKSSPQKSSSPSKTPDGISSSELERRKKALAIARKREEEEKNKRDADEKSREAEREKKRADLETKEKEEQERKEKEKEKREEEKRAIAAVIEAKKLLKIYLSFLFQMTLVAPHQNLLENYLNEKRTENNKHLEHQRV